MKKPRNCPGLLCVWRLVAREVGGESGVGGGVGSMYFDEFVVEAKE